MKCLLLVVTLLSALAVPAQAMEFSAPTVPKSAEEYMGRTDNFAEGLWYVIKTAIKNIHPHLVEAGQICLKILAVIVVTGIVKSFTGASAKATETIGMIAIAVMVLEPSDSLIQLGIGTVQDISEYGKLLMPVLSGALAAQGAPTMSTSLYAGTMMFLGILTTVISKIIAPMLYVFLALSVCAGITEDVMIQKISGIIKWAVTWSLKIILYVFTGYMTITGAIGGSTDATAVKATKLAISGAVPVVGGIMSDASETILVSAGLMKNTVGVYGTLAILAIGIGPFVKCAAHYILLKLTAALCGVFNTKNCTDMVEKAAAVMGLSLAMTGVCCLLLFISSICFMKGAG